MKKPEVPCFECKVRTTTCHAKCKSYSIFLNNLKEYNEKVRIEKECNPVLTPMDFFRHSVKH